MRRPSSGSVIKYLSGEENGEWWGGGSSLPGRKNGNCIRVRHRAGKRGHTKGRHDGTASAHDRLLGEKSTASASTCVGGGWRMHEPRLSTRSVGKRGLRECHRRGSRGHGRSLGEESVRIRLIRLHSAERVLTQRRHVPAAVQGLACGAASARRVARPGLVHRQGVVGEDVGAGPALHARRKALADAGQEAIEEGLEGGFQRCLHGWGGRMGGRIKLSRRGRRACLRTAVIAVGGCGAATHVGGHRADAKNSRPVRGPRAVPQIEYRPQRQRQRQRLASRTRRHPVDHSHSRWTLG